MKLEPGQEVEVWWHGKYVPAVIIKVVNGVIYWKDRVWNDTNHLKQKY